MCDGVEEIVERQRDVLEKPEDTLDHVPLPGQIVRKA
jgi:hypothetical protein